mmetsp:Transcript_12089/g.22616  ORF Transcript_12089/g.22616 Transcript_12089/m.22616 type:complete len:1103 (-) Transcript_12089:973-4281(-)
MTSSNSPPPPSSSPSSSPCVVTSELEFHGAAASSSPHSILRLDDHSIMYASNCILNIAIPKIPLRVNSNDDDDDDDDDNHHGEDERGHVIQSSGQQDELENISSSFVYVVKQTLRTTTVPRTDWKRSITALSLLSPVSDSRASKHQSSLSSLSWSCKKYVACAFSDGSITIWAMSKDNTFTGGEKWKWKEYVVNGITEHDDTDDEICQQEDHTISIADIDGVYYSEHVGHEDQGSVMIHQFQLFTASARGVKCHVYTKIIEDDSIPSMDTTTARSFPTKRSFFITNHPTCTLKISTLDNQLILGVGTALPRNNRVHFYTLDISTLVKNVKLLQQQQQQQQEDEKEEMEHGWKHQGSVMGHLDWISCLDWNFNLVFESETSAGGVSCGFQGGMLASGSQDARIRLWRFHQSILCGVAECDYEFLMEKTTKQNGDGEEDMEEEEEDEEDANDEDLLEEGEARMYIYYQNMEGVHMKCAITLEALLIGHEEGVTSVQWRPNSNKPCLLSSSMDRSILIWMEEEMDETEEVGSSLVTSEGLGNVWVPITRVGTAGGILGGSIGSSLLGFINALWSNDGRQIVGHGFGGAIYFWSSSENYEASVISTEEQRVHSSSLERWRATPGITGHFRECCDISWEVTKGTYLLSAGMDQTCRLWMPLLTESLDHCGCTQANRIWKEVGRPQVHGYDLNSVVCIGDANGELIHRFVSGADEKEIRAFDSPIQTIRLVDILKGKTEECAIPDSEQRVDRAFIPSLGLSNRANLADAMEEGTDNAVQSEPASSTQITSLDSKRKIMRPLDHYLPTERDLGVLSLWPEVRKLYGHLTEIVCLASTAGRCSSLENSQVLVASSCKARDADNAAIRVWNIEQNVCIDVLKDGHKSTVVSLTFSSDGKFLASAGKDRRLCIWKKCDNIQNKVFDLAAVVESAHKRIIWSLDFCVTRPSILASGSRDGYVKIWEVTSINSSVSEAVQVKEISRFEPVCKGGKKAEPITALAFAPKERNENTQNDGCSHNDAIIVVGMESGLVEVWAVPLNIRNEIKGEGGYTHPKPFILCSIPIHDCHISMVKKLAWRPLVEENNQDDDDVLTLASCSNDNGIRLYSIKLS